ncbi:MAG: DUF599 domain-containing protein [Methylococcales bacterium]|nr:DUF599 domain-containing protein [Methylococcales bacterium]
MSHDIMAFLCSCLLVWAYYIYLARRTRRAPDSSVHTLNASIRRQWVDLIMTNNGKLEILAIQTLRNSVMAANFMASTAVLLIIGSLNLSPKIGEWAAQWYPHSVALSVTSQLWQIKLGLLLLDFFMAFFCFAMSIRFFNHVGYMINLPNNTGTERNLFHQTCAYLNRAGRYYTLGTRMFFFSLPIILWFFGPYFLIPATLALIAALAILDRVPQ